MRISIAELRQLIREGLNAIPPPPMTSEKKPEEKPETGVPVMKSITGKTLTMSDLDRNSSANYFQTKTAFKQKHDPTTWLGYEKPDSNSNVQDFKEVISCLRKIFTATTIDDLYTIIEDSPFGDNSQILNGLQKAREKLGADKRGKWWQLSRSDSEQFYLEDYKKEWVKIGSKFCRGMMEQFPKDSVLVDHCKKTIVWLKSQ